MQLSTFFEQIIYCKTAFNVPKQSKSQMFLKKLLDYKDWNTTEAWSTQLFASLSLIK